MHHPLRKNLGKIAELASGYGGWVKAWIKFGADKYMNEEEMKRNILKWRDESPAIIDFWAGLEDSAIKAVESPGQCFGYRDIRYQTKGGVLYCQLPSGRAIPYHSPQISEGMRYGKLNKSLSYMGVGDQTKWIRLHTYGGKLAENVSQATSRDIFAPALIKLEDAGYPVVLQTHDEPCSEVPMGFGSIEQYEAIMQDSPAWCADWPIKADGGWRGHRYRKE